MGIYVERRSNLAMLACSLTNYYYYRFGLKQAPSHVLHQQNLFYLGQTVQNCIDAIEP